MWMVASLVAATMGTLVGAACAAEVLVPFDTRGKVLKVDARLADRIGLFTAQHPGFAEARLFQLEDSTFVLEIARRVGDTQVRERIPLDAAGADSVRSLVQERIGDRAPSAHYDQEARPLLVATGAAMGFGFYGWAITDLLDVTDEKAFAAYMLTAAGTIILPNMLTERQNVSYSQVSLGFYGATRGIIHGALVSSALDPEGESDSETDLSIALGVSVGEGILGYALGTGRTPGQSAAIGLGGDLGLAYGFGFAELMESEDDRDRSLTVLGVTAAGLAGGYALGHLRDYSYGDVGIMRTGAVLGGITGWLLSEDLEGGDTGPTVVASMAGGAIGLVLGDRIVDGAGYSFGQSISVDFVTLSGGLIGLSIAALAADNGWDDSIAPRAITLAGAFGGYALGISSQAPGGRPAKASSLRLGVEPRWVSTHGGKEMVPHVVAQMSFGPRGGSRD